MNQLTKNVKDVMRKKRKLVCIFLTLGYRSLKQTETLILEFEKSGVDMIELGIPFSDPLADGPTIQRASDYALKQGVELRDAFRLVKKLRLAGSRIPIVLFSYFNPIYHAGIKTVSSLLKKSGFQGVVIPDLPPDEAVEFQRILRKDGLAQIYLVAPTTSRQRAKRIVRRAEGFVYYVSLRGVTGARRTLDPNLSKQVRHLKHLTRKPVLVGFGVSSVKHVKQVCGFADGVIVGSAVIQAIEKLGSTGTVKFVRSLVKAAKAV